MARRHPNRSSPSACHYFLWASWEDEMSKNDFYVYAHRKSTNGEVFYIGKGKGSRASDKKMRNRHWKFIAKKHGYTVEIVESGLQEWAAFEIEKNLIALHGRMDLGLGSLVNYTDGGDGASGCVMKESTKNKISMALKGIKKSEEAKLKMSSWQIGKLVSNETRLKISLGNTGKKQTQEQKDKISMSCKKNTRRSGAHYRAKKVICKNTGVIFESVADAAKWLVSIGNKKASHTSILHVCNGRHAQSYGYVWSYA
jgi:hypothetical protein